MKTKLGILAISTLFFMSGCSTGTSDKAAESEQKTDEIVSETAADSVSVMEKDGLKVYSYTASPTFEDATLSITAPENGAELSPGDVKFTFDVGNYELGAATDGAGTNGLANSDMGQHIHAILNNQPYMAHYDPEFVKELDANNYVLLSFLSRSYHESLKHKSAMDIIKFTVGDAQPDTFDLDAPHIFYSRPKGTYKADTDKILLDFYLVNCELSPEGYNVRATINGTEFMLTDWTAYIIEGLPMGKSVIKLELLDSEGNLVEGPYNPSERSITLGEGE